MAVRAGADVFAVSFCDGSVSIDFESCEYNPVLHAAKTADNKYYMVSVCVISGCLLRQKKKEI